MCDFDHFNVLTCVLVAIHVFLNRIQTDSFWISNTKKLLKWITDREKLA